MFCNKCGTQNPDASLYCSKCGEKLNISSEAQAPAQSPKKRKTGLLVGLAVGGVALIAAAVVLVLIFTSVARSVTGDWYSKEYGEVFTFRADGTVLVATAYGQVEGSYKFDPGSGRGVINVDGKDIEFAVEGGSLVLSGEGNATATFDRVEDASMIAGVLPVPSSEVTPPSVVTEPPVVTTPSAETTAPVITPVTTENPPTAAPTTHTTHHSTPAPTPTPVVLPAPATPPPTPTPSTVILLPIIVIDNTDVLGNWRRTDSEGDWTLTFDSDNTFYITGTTSSSGTFYYNSTTLTGTLTASFGISLDFYLSTDKQLLYLNGHTYNRS